MVGRWKKEDDEDKRLEEEEEAGLKIWSLRSWISTLSSGLAIKSKSWLGIEEDDDDEEEEENLIPPIMDFYSLLRTGNKV